MTGTIALHGGGEFLPGDEAFLAAILAAAPSSGDVLRAVVVPTAAARGRPGLAAANGVSALTEVAAASSRRVEAEAVPIVDAAGAADDGLAARLHVADLIYFQGGDPDLIPTLLRGTAAWAATVDAWSHGAALAGASAGAMALGTWTWTADGGVPGLGLVPGLFVVPHADARSWPRSLERFGAAAPPVWRSSGSPSGRAYSSGRTARGGSSVRAKSAGSPRDGPVRTTPGSTVPATPSSPRIAPDDPVPDAPSAGALQPGRDPVHGQLDEPQDAVAIWVIGCHRAQPGEQSDLELGQRVDIRVAQADRALTGGRAIEQTLAAGDLEK